MTSTIWMDENKIILQILIISYLNGIGSLNWAACISKILTSNPNEHFEFCDLCYVKDRDLAVIKPPTLTIFSQRLLTILNCYDCDSKQWEILNYFFKSYNFVQALDQISGETNFAGVLALVMKYLGSSYAQKLTLLTMKLVEN